MFVMSVIGKMESSLLYENVILKVVKAYMKKLTHVQLGLNGVTVPLVTVSRI